MSFSSGSLDEFAFPMNGGSVAGDSEWHDEFYPGMEVSLCYTNHGVVGKGTVIEGIPTGRWLGVDINLNMVAMTLLRPTKILDEARNLLLQPLQESVFLLADSIGRTVLWEASQVALLSKDPSMEPDLDGTSGTTTAPPFVPQAEWVGLVVRRYGSDGNLIASGRVNCSLPNEPFQDSTLGEGNIGVTVFDVFIGDQNDIMSHQRWPIPECFLEGGRGLSETVAHFIRIPHASDPNAHLGGRLKAPYRFVVRKKRTEEKLSAYSKKTSQDVVQAVSSQSCCPDECVRLFRPQDTLFLRQRYFLKDFDDRREYGIAVGGQLRHMGNNQKRTYVTLLGQDVCATAWYKIHGIPKSTFHNYIDQYRKGILSSTHGNRGVKRPRLGTVQAMGIISAIINENADHMPHQMRTTVPGRMDTLKFLPSGHSWKRIQADATETNLEYGLPKVSQSVVSRIKKELFNNVAVKPVGSSFAKCTLCDTLQRFISKSVKGSAEYVSFIKQRHAHLNHQASCRRVYHSWREESKRKKGEIICIIHDKMDTAKTAIPRIRVTTKQNSALGQLPLNVTGMVTHGHGDGAYAHYSTDLWPGDSNFTISSIARLLRRLEEPPIRDTGRLFPYEPANSLFEALLKGKSRRMDVLPTVVPNHSTAAVPLPNNLYLQLDNSAKDNKNQFLMAFLSMLTYRRVFKEIQVGFLLVGHTHEDIDAYFSHLSKALKNRNTFVVADLMMSFMESQDMNFMPEFVQEVADFKSFVSGYICDGAERLVGLGEMHLFKFYVDEDGWPVMRYKMSAIDPHWLPRNKPGLHLWKEDNDGNPIIPSGFPNPIPFKRLWGDKVPSSTGNQVKAREKAAKALDKRSFIKSGIRGYIQYWEQGMRSCEGFRRDFPPYVAYWNAILAELEEPLPPTPSALVEGFWPIHDWSATIRTPLNLGAGEDVTPEDGEPELYCGPRSEKPKDSLNPWRDVVPGSWVLLRPSDPEIYPVWLGRAYSAVNREVGHEEYGKFILQFWEPRNAFKDHKKKYEDCWTSTWVPENGRPVHVHVDAVLFASWSKKSDPKTRTIPQRDRVAAMINLAAANEADP